MKNYFRICIMILSLLQFPGGMLSGAEKSVLPPNVRNFAPGYTFPGHLQGIAADESGIYWSCYDRIIKTDWEGKKLHSVLVPPHAGDCCVKDGKLYVSVAYYRQKDIIEKKIRAAIYIYDCRTLRFIKYVPVLDEALPDGITWCGDLLYVSDSRGGSPDHRLHFVNVVYVYDKNFKLQRREVISAGVPTVFGAQTLHYWDGKLLGCFYTSRHYRSSHFFDLRTMKVTGSLPLDGSVGLARVPESVAGRRGIILRGLLAGKRGSYSARGAFYLLKDGKVEAYPARFIKMKRP